MSDLRKVGLSYVCSDDCVRSVQQRQQKVQAKKAAAKVRVDARKSHLGSRMRRQIRERDGQVCRFCSKSAFLMEVHHVLYRSEGGPDSALNLILLCDEHHRLVHSDKRRWQKVLLAVLWRHYAEAVFTTIPQTRRYLINQGLIQDD